MALVLTPSPSRKRRVNLDNRDPLDTRDIPEDEDPYAQPADSTPTSPSRRPELTLGDGASNASADFRTANAVAGEPILPETRPRVVDEYANQVDKLRHLESTPAKDQNGRWKSFLLNALDGASQAARAAIQTRAQNPAALILGGAAGGGASGLARPSLDEEREQAAEAEYTRGRVAEELGREDKQAELGYKRIRPQLELGRAQTQAAEAQIAAERVRVEQQVEQGRMTRAQADAKLRDLDRQSREREGQLNRESRERVAGMTREKPKIPDTYYRGKNDDLLKDMALQRATASGQFDQTKINPAVLQAYGGDVTKVYKALRNDDLTPAQAFTDPSKGVEFERALASSREQITREAQEFDRALDMTSKSPTATRITYADFESAWESFVSKYKAASTDDARNDVRRRFENELRKVRLVGE